MQRKTSSDRTGSSDKIERVQTFTKLFSLFPLSQGQEIEAAIRSYMDLTADIPIRWVRKALWELVTNRNRDFAPSIGAIRAQTAIEIRKKWREVQGFDPEPWTAHGNETLEINRWVDIARVRDGLPKLYDKKPPERITPKTPERVKKADIQRELKMETVESDQKPDPRARDENDCRERQKVTPPEEGFV
jgi:hypothetical protein